MALIECKDCEIFVSDSAKICPKCGCPIEISLDLKKNVIPKNVIPKNVEPTKEEVNKGCLIIVIAIIVLIIIVATCNSNSEEEEIIYEDKDLEKRYFENLKEDSIKNKYNDSIFQIEEQKFLNSKAGRIYKKHPDWSKDDCEKLANNQFWIGMKYEMLVYLRGKPNDINTSNYGAGNEYQAIWNDYDTKYFYFKDDHIIYAYN